jgi:drug/metabolite transporter (DMT)-like permease
MSQNRLLRTAAGTRAGAFGPNEWALTIACGLIWGTSFLLIAVGLESFAPNFITWLRIVAGLAAISCMPSSWKPIERRDWPAIVFLGVFYMAFPLALFPLAQRHVSSAVTGMLNGATPLFVAVVAALMLRRLPRRQQAIGVFIGFIGVVLIALPTLGEGSSSSTGVALILIALVSYGVSVNVIVPLQHRYGSLPVLWRIQIVALILMVPFAIAGLGESSFEWRPFLAILVLGVLGTGVAYAMATTLGGRVGGTRASLITYLIPVVSIVVGRMFRGDHIYVLAGIGTVVVLAGAWIASRAEQ